MPTVLDLVSEVARVVGHDGTADLRTIVECALRDGRGHATVEEIVEIVREARKYVAAERECQK